jgi:sulfoxide reductase heme-binding subunit YedZ
LSQEPSRVERTVRRFIRPALWALVLLPAPVLIAQLLLDQLGADPIDKLERLTGEWALRFLIASLAVTPLMRLSGWGWLVAQRRFLGLAAFFWAFGHLSVYTVLDWFFDWQEIIKDVTKHLYITLGMAAFLLMIPLALTSSKAAIRKMGGARWNRLHSLVYLSVIGACLHFVWAVKKDITEPVIYGGIAAVLLAIRVVWRPAPRGVRIAPREG